MRWRWCVVSRSCDVSRTRRGLESVGAPAGWPRGGSGQCVALLLNRSAEAITAILAVLKSGAAYLPIDPMLSDARIEFMLADAAPVVAVTTAGLAGRLDGCGLPVIDDRGSAASTAHPGTGDAGGTCGR